MRLTASQRLGPNEILGPLGAGGMGEVYRALDPRLGREVAIKVLPADRVAEEGRRRRFVQEAKAASALNHPNIVTIHEIESADGIDFIVMECVPGRTLDALIPKGGIPPGGLRIAIPIADGREGVVKVLDFGLAKLAAEARSARSFRAWPPTVMPSLRVASSTTPAALRSPSDPHTALCATGTRRRGRTVWWRRSRPTGSAA